MTAKITSKLDATGRVSVPRTVRDSWEMGSAVRLEVLKNGDGLRLSRARQTTGDCYTLNSQNRLFVPAELREQAGWEADLILEWKVADDFVLIGRDLQVCEICYSDRALAPVRQTFLCADCLDEAGKNKLYAWEKPLDRLVSRFTEACSYASDGEMADLNEAREVGGELHAVLHFLGVPADHELLITLDKADRRLRKVIEPARMMEAFEAWQTKTGKKKRALVYEHLTRTAGKKQRKQSGKLGKLNRIVNEDFEESWHTFKVEELYNLFEACDVDTRRKAYELAVEEAEAEWNQARGAGEDHFQASLASAASLEQSVSELIAVCRYLEEAGEHSDGNDLDRLQDRQLELSRLCDIKTRLDEVDRRKEELDVKQKHIRGVKKEMLGEV
ncbi:hypothetical protein [Alteribacter natronophilus]|uniref:hypothetical protein n=1 Tax=Alteribacter natronophilus TaxID=2583810 RepID=UPI00110F49FD|nr:hypothetical protein [Alteribacter natronophilus]TMW70973.1 hypothetical protein FGB90_13445 [Alteribacter natronophilus]